MLHYGLWRLRPRRLIVDFLGVVQTGLNLQNARFQTLWTAAIARKGLDAQKIQGDLVMQLLESAQIPPVQADGKGVVVDTIA
jgi:hypothetical protein